MKSTYLALFVISCCTLVFELLLTRIFSVTMTYHLAFIAISVGMFGMTIGALIVYLLPRHFPPQAVSSRLTIYGLLFALSMPLCLWWHLQMRFGSDYSVAAMFPILFVVYCQVAIPFIFSGICICLALTSFKDRVGSLYATDLVGAALGCVTLPVLFDYFDGVTSVIVLSFFVSLGVLGCAWNNRRVRYFCIVSAITFGLLAPINVLFEFFTVTWAKGRSELQLKSYEKWNTFARIMVGGDQFRVTNPFYWGGSAARPADLRTAQLWILIDSFALTALPQYERGKTSLEYLKYDLTNIGYYLMKPNSDALVIGVGGGRDILSALAFGAKEVDAVEINADIINLLTWRYKRFNQLASDPRVRLINDEARSYITRNNKRYDSIQISLVDTFAATAAGAFVFTENSLYTVEAWKLFLQRLTPDGILSCSHWYESDPPAHFYRVIALACQAMHQLGIQNPRQHIIVVYTKYSKRGLATMLVSRDQFSQSEIDTLRATAQRLQFDVLIDPLHASNSFLQQIIEKSTSKEIYDQATFKLSPPTDDSPFLFQASKDNLSTWLGQATSPEAAALRLSLIMTAVCMIFPFFLTVKRVPVKNSLVHVAFFFAIGIGFMFFEIAQLQRLTIFLGHPSYALPVVLGSLLVSTGLGSLATQLCPNNKFWSDSRVTISCLIVVLWIINAATPGIVATYAAARTTERILISLALTVPAGLLLGTAFPLGLRAVPGNLSALGPWLWAVNGAGSVCAATVALLVAMSAGITNTFYVAIGSYVIALLLVLIRNRKGNPEPQAAP